MKYYSNFIYISKNMYTNIYLILDKIHNYYIYIIYKQSKIIKYLYIINDIYILFINYINIILYLIPKFYKNIYKLINLQLYILIKHKIIINIIGLNYKFYYINKFHILILQLKYSHYIILKLPIKINCKIDNIKSMIYLYSDNVCLLNVIGNLLQSFQYTTKYKNVGIIKLK